MKLTNKKIVFGAIALLIVGGALYQTKCQAQAEIQGSYVTDFIERGVSITDGAAQVSVGVDVPLENNLLPNTGLYADFSLTRPNDGENLRNVYVGTTVGTKLVQVDLGLRYFSGFGSFSDTELYGGVKLDTLGNPGVYVCNSQDLDFNTIELRVSEGLKWGLLPEQVTIGVNGRVGYKEATESSTFVEGAVTVAYALTDKTQLFVAGIGGTSTADSTEYRTGEVADVVGLQAGVRSTF